MEFDDNNVPEEQDDDYVEIYSKKAVWWFSVFSPLFGSVLLMINLWAAGFKNAVYQVALFLIAFAAASNIAMNKLFPNYKIGTTPATVDINKLLILFGVSLVFNIIAAVVITFFFFKRYFPDDDYYPKSIQTPLLILVGLTFLFMIMGVGI